MDWLFGIDKRAVVSKSFSSDTCIGRNYATLKQRLLHAEMNNQLQCLPAKALNQKLSSPFSEGSGGGC